MTCQQVQSSLSLYLYGELDFANEEAVESHLAQCAACQLSLAREKQWHTLANTDVSEPPLDLLAECRQQLRPALAREVTSVGQGAKVHSWWRWAKPFDVSLTRWSTQLAAASLLVFLGFACGRYFESRAPGAGNSGFQQMGLVNPAQWHVRDIQPVDGGSVRIVADQPVEVVGRLEDARIRGLLLNGARQDEPAIRFYALRTLTQSPDFQSDDLRQMLVEVARQDPNPAVRLQAVNGLGRYASDPMALETFEFILEHDDDAGVRGQALNTLVPPGNAEPANPAVTRVLQDVLVSAHSDDYVRARSAQALKVTKVPVVY